MTKQISSPTVGELLADRWNDLLVDCEDCSNGEVILLDRFQHNLHCTPAALDMRCSGCGSKRVIITPPKRRDPPFEVLFDEPQQGHFIVFYTPYLEFFYCRFAPRFGQR